MRTWLILVDEIDEQFVAMIKPKLTDRPVVSGELCEGVAQHVVAADVSRSAAGRHGPAVAVRDRVVEAPRDVVLVARGEKLADQIAGAAGLLAGSAERRGLDGVVRRFARPVHHALLVLRREYCVRAAHRHAALDPLVRVQIDRRVEL